jgi:hypothetical protein
MDFPTRSFSMRALLPCLFLVAVSPLIFAEGTSVTTAPSVSEVEQLRAKVKALQAENDLLRAQLAATLGTAPAAAAPVKAPADGTDAPLAGVEGILQGFPKQQMPTLEDAEGSLRGTLLTRWVKEHGQGKMITLHAHFADATGLQGHQFTVRVGSGVSHQIAHPFEATAVLPESEATRVLPFHKWTWVVLTGHIKTIGVSRDGDGNFVIQMELDGATITADPTKGF